MKLIELEALASETLSTNNKESRAHLLRLLNTGLLADVIDSLLTSKAEIIDVASRSYHHNNGFLKIVLIDNRPRYSIRLHIWPQESFQAPDIHNHPWDMTGLVLNGAYKWPTYTPIQVLDRCNSFNLFECRYLDDYSGHSFHEINKVTLNKTGHLKLQKGDIFNLHHTQYHSVTKENSQHAESLVITGHSTRLSANVITNRKIACNSTHKNPSIESSFLQEKLSSFLKRSLR